MRVINGQRPTNTPDKPKETVEYPDWYIEDKQKEAWLWKFKAMIRNPERQEVSDE